MELMPPAGWCVRIAGRLGGLPVASGVAVLMKALLSTVAEMRTGVREEEGGGESDQRRRSKVDVLLEGLGADIAK